MHKGSAMQGPALLYFKPHVCAQAVVLPAPVVNMHVLSARHLTGSRVLQAWRHTVPNK
jgi:hypothetical protein